jgi:sulfotransferase family protein
VTGGGPGASPAARSSRSDSKTLPGRLPDFVIIGAMKAATSSLAAYLDAHTEARCSRETHFFCCNYDNGIDWYRDHFTDAGAARLIGEKTPHYLHSPEAINRMAALLPGAKLIALLRDPVDRALSHYWHERRRQREPLPFRDALEAEPERLARGDMNLGYLQRGRYLPQLEHVVTRYPRDALLVILFEDLRDRPAETFAGVCRFLGIDDGVLPPVVG